ncbi:O-antigen polymerase [Shouchella clausii]|uniref:O-antigen polymerase n=1 Tax=Shouchella clausii TaxID=79880 RepID=UPI0039837C2D
MINNSKWWSSPYGIVAYFLLPIYCFIFLVTNNNLIAGTKNYFSLEFFLLGLLYLCIFLFSAFLGTRISLTRKKFETTNLYVKPFFLDLLALLTITAYIVWFGELLFKPELIINILLGQGGTDGVRHFVSTVPGVTTLSQLGILYSIIFLNCYFDEDYKLKKRYFFYFFIIIFLTLFRVVAWSERLAFIEILIPTILIVVANLRLKTKILIRMIKYAPYIGVVLLLVFFGATEYFRSWNYYRNQYNNNIIEFVLERVMNYYSTSLNNGAGIIENFSGLEGNLWFLLNWLYKLPIIGDKFVETFDANPIISDFLKRYANEEYNNPSGLFIIAQELGIFGGMVYVLLFGLLAGSLYRSFYFRNGIGVYLYPIVYISILEFFRLVYLSESRTFPILLFGLIGYLFFTRKKRKEASYER